ncbi:MAG: phosphonate C-P lyase system protein PhnH [Rhodospirillales bacterium]|nr:phosphonate C-P lyase system protein PhnH [Rhodospirillales bacterium]
MIALPDRPGFADPVAQAQQAFRAILEAMSRPGRIVEAGATLDPPPPLPRAAAAALLTLADGDTKLWLDPAFAAAHAWVRFHTGAPPARGAEEADFVLAADWPDLATLRTGTDEAPEAGATLILSVAALGEGMPYRLSGPGLAAPTAFAVRGLPEDFPARWAANRASFPCGIDLILCAGALLAALPRGIAMEAGPCT